MTKYHINKQGIPAMCRAREGNCPYGGSDGKENHFNTAEEAQAYANKIFEREYSFLPVINIYYNSGPADDYDNTNFNRLFNTYQGPKVKINLLRNLSPKDLNIFQDDLIVGDSDKYKFNKDTSGRLFNLDLGDQDNNSYLDMIDKAADKSYSKAARFFIQSPSNLTDEYVVNSNYSDAYVGRKLDGEYQSMTNKPSVIRKNVAAYFDGVDDSPQINYDIRDYYNHPEQLDYKDIPIMRKCFGEPLRKSDVKIMQDNIIEIMEKERESRDAILASNPDESTKEFAHKYYNSRSLDIMSDVCAMSAVHQVEGQAYVFDKDFIDSMGPVYDNISSMADKRLGLDKRSFENLSDYTRARQNSGYRFDAVEKAVIKDIPNVEHLTKYGIGAARESWAELMEETKDKYKDLYGV